MDHDTPLFDLQVNGYAGVDLNQDALTAEGLDHLCTSLERDGVSGFLATVITDHVDVMARRLSTLVRLRSVVPSAQRAMVGFHIEGPFINRAEGYRGAHPPDAICEANADQVKRLLDAADGLTRLVTLAPEVDPGARVTRMLADAGVTVAAGHTDASLEQLRGAIDNGLTAFTHLGNGCPVRLHRHDNIIQRVLSLTPQLWVTFLADGEHIPFWALRNYIDQIGVERCVIVSDAISAAGVSPGRHQFGRLDLSIQKDKAPQLPGSEQFAGATCTMRRAVENLTGPVGLTLTQAIQMTSTGPRRAIGYD